MRFLCKRRANADHWRLRTTPAISLDRRWPEDQPANGGEGANLLLKNCASLIQRHFRKTF